MAASAARLPKPLSVRPSGTLREGRKEKLQGCSSAPSQAAEQPPRPLAQLQPLFQRAVDKAGVSVQPGDAERGRATSASPLTGSRAPSSRPARRGGGRWGRAPPEADPVPSPAAMGQDAGLRASGRAGGATPQGCSEERSGDALQTAEPSDPLRGQPQPAAGLPGAGWAAGGGESRSPSASELGVRGWGVRAAAREGAGPGRGRCGRSAVPKPHLAAGGDVEAARPRGWGLRKLFPSSLGTAAGSTHEWFPTGTREKSRARRRGGLVPRLCWAGAAWGEIASVEGGKWRDCAGKGLQACAGMGRGWGQPEEGEVRTGGAVGYFSILRRKSFQLGIPDVC